MKSKLNAAICFAVCLIATRTAHCAPIDYALLDLGAFNSWGDICGINNSGLIAGTEADVTGIRTFVWDPDAGKTYLGSGYAYSINNRGQVAGYSLTDGSLIWNPNGTTTSLPGSGGDANLIPWAINDSGLVAGSLWAPTGFDQAYICDTVSGGSPVPHGEVVTSEAKCINSGGAVAGWLVPVGESLLHAAFAWDEQNGFRTLSVPLGWTSSIANGINDAGLIVGGAIDGSRHPRAVLWDADGVPADLGLGWATDINNSGRVLGWQGMPWVWDPNGDRTFLTTLPGAVLTTAAAINDFGLIAGTVKTADGATHAVLWRPAPEPSGVLAVIVGLSGLAWFRTRRR